LSRYREAAPRFALEPREPHEATNFDAFGFDVLLLGQRVPVTMRDARLSGDEYRRAQAPSMTLANVAMRQGPALAAVESCPDLLAPQPGDDGGWQASFATILNTLGAGIAPKVRAGARA
jgi:hypothetical protein